MASKNELNKIAKARIGSSQSLILVSDWEGAAQMMGLALECALKAAICKTLRLSTYPEKHDDDKVAPFFMTHSFERLLLLSGLSETFSAAGDAGEFNNWSIFVGAYPGEWVSMRYNDPRYGPFNKENVEKLFDCLYGDKDKGIIRVIAKKKRW